MSDATDTESSPKRGARLRVVVASGNDGPRAERARILADQPDLSVVAEAGSGPAALDAIEDAIPDVAVVDVDLLQPDGSPASLCRTLSERFPAVRLLVIIDDDDADSYQPARDGAAGAVLAADADALPDAVRRLARGEGVLTSGWAGRVLAELDQLIADPGRLAATTPEVTPTEREVLQRMAGGASAAEVAALHDVPVRLVTLHAGSALSKVSRAFGEHRRLSTSPGGTP